MPRASQFVRVDNPKRKRAILSVRLLKEVDDSPDLSFIGEYSNTPEGDCAIDRKERGDQERGEYRYFNPTMTGEETGNPESPEQDYLRMEAYNRGDWYMIGIYAVAKVLSSGGVIQEVRSGGLWGTESDSEQDYLKSIGKEELDALRDELIDMGFSKREINKAFKGVELENA